MAKTQPAKQSKLQQKRADLDDTVKAAKYVADTQASIRRCKGVQGISGQLLTAIESELGEMEKNPTKYIEQEKARLDTDIARREAVAK